MSSYAIKGGQARVGRRSTRRSTTCVAVDSGKRRRPRAGKIAGVVSPFLTVEEAYLMATYLKGLDSE